MDKLRQWPTFLSAVPVHKPFKMDLFTGRFGKCIFQETFGNNKEIFHEDYMKNK